MNPVVNDDGLKVATLSECAEYLADKKYTKEANKTSDSLYRKLIRDRITDTIESYAVCMMARDGRKIFVNVKDFAMKWNPEEASAIDAITMFYESVIDVVGEHGELILRQLPRIDRNLRDGTYTISMRLAHLDS